MKKKVLVAGGAGFLGSHLCERLLKQGCEVVCVDNFLTGRKENIVPFLQNPFFHFLEKNICEPFDVVVDEIYNLACPASPPHYQKDPILTLKTSVLGSLHLLELAKKTKAKIFQASTSEVYGDPFVHPQKEEYWGNVNPIGVRSCYDEGKRCAETLFFDYWRRDGVEIKVARIFNTYGPRMQIDDGRVISNFITQALKKEDLTVYGKGTQTRSFCYVEDLMDGILALMNTPKEFVGPVNLGNPIEFTILELASIVLEMTKSSSKIVFKDLPFDDPKQRKPNIDLAKKQLAWAPKVFLEEGLSLTIPHFQKVLSRDADCLFSCF